MPQNLPSIFQQHDAPPKGSPAESGYDATHDSLTGLLNRRGADEAFAYLESQMSGNFAVISFDLDELKPVNDKNGHAAGDELLQRTANALQNALRTDQSEIHPKRRGSEDAAIPDLIASRVGGDEFLAILPGVDKQSQADSIENRLQDSLQSVGVNASSGSAVHLGDRSEMLDLADARMFFDKTKKQTKSFDALPRRKKFAARLGESCLRYAGVRPPRHLR